MKVPSPLGKSRYTHDCKWCVYLGPYIHSRWVKGHPPEPVTSYDLYYCPKGDNPEIASSVIARFSDDGPDYISGNVFSYMEHNVLFEARKRAEALGIEVPEDG